MNNTHATLARIIRYHRRQAGLSQKELASMAGVGKTVVFDIEHEHPGVKLSTLLSILHILNIRLSFESPLMKAFEEHDDEKS